MQYLITFLEGVITFVSPCLLPMLPVYLFYFAGGGKKNGAVINTLGFILGFTAVFVTLGALSGVFGGLLIVRQSVLNAVAGCVIIFFGLNYLGAFKNFFDRFFSRKSGEKKPVRVTGFISAVIFGVVFSMSWTQTLMYAVL